MSAATDPRQVIVFLGPTMPVDEARGIVEADYRPPVAQGDLYRAALEGPAAIAVIDGRFGSVPAVWHKEILWALSNGIHVLGSSSMGALRAAELDVYGMEGFGEIYRWYRDGLIDADDEVAVAHGPPEDGYRNVSDALVNIRATVRRAVDQQVIGEPEAQRYVERARQLFYPERSWPALLAHLPHPGLAEWLRTGRVDRKRDDALVLLHELRDRVEAGIEPRDSDLRVEQSQVWARARAVAGGATPGAEDLPFDLLADELRLRAATPATSAYTALYKETLLRQLMLDAADRLGLTMDDEQATLQRVDAHFFDETLRRLPAQAASSGDYDEVVKAARRKAELLAEGSGTVPDPSDLGTSSAALVSSFFATRGSAAPPQNDLERFARAAGFADIEAFHRALALDHLLTAGRAGQPTRNGDPI